MFAASNMVAAAPLTLSQSPSGSSGPVAGVLPSLWNQSPPTGASPTITGTTYTSPNAWETAPIPNIEIYDNFDGAANSAINSNYWFLDLSNSGGAQTYSTSHVYLDGSSHAVLHATGTQAGGWTSGRFDSMGKWLVQYGWLSARIKLPSITGCLPAWWTFATGYGAGAHYGEIDIMEGYGPMTTMNTHLWSGTSTSPGTSGSSTVGSGEIAADVTTPSEFSGDLSLGFHNYWLYCNSTTIQCGVDDYIMGTWTASDLGSASAYWDGLTRPAFPILNFAVGGFSGWLGNPPDSAFPADMLVDWVWYKPLALM